jgi:hypothetical protein
MAQDPTAAKVVAACEAEWSAYSNDCSGFVRAVAGDLGISLAGQANAIIDALDTPSRWENLGTNPQLASLRAAQGCLVVAGLKATPNGHVAVVVDAPAQAYPVGYWGKLDDIGKKNTGLNWAWRKSDLVNVKYYSCVL